MKNNTLFLSEKLILKSVRDLLAVEGFFVVRMQAGFGVHKGIADIYAIKSGVSLWIETKTKTGKLSEYQKTFQKQVQEHGGIYLVIRDVDELIDYLMGMNLGSSRLF